MQRPAALRRRSLLLMAASSALGVPPVWAGAAPSEVTAALPSARLKGQGTMRYFGLKVYEASLWVSASFEAARFQDHRFALELQYYRSLDGKAIAQRSLEEMRREGGFSEVQAQAWLVAMTQAFPDVAEGDRLTGLFTPAAPTRFFVNAKARAEVADPDFGPIFAGIWLAGSTSEPGLRQRLLGAA